MADAEASLREPVVAAYGALLATHPSLAPEVTRDLIVWGRWDHVDRAREIRTALAEQDPLGAYALDLYLRAAAGAARPGLAVPSVLDNGRTHGVVGR